MPEARRRVKCSETYEPFPSHLLSSRAASFQKNLIPHPDLSLFYFLLYFLCLAVTHLQKGYLGERSSPRLTLLHINPAGLQTFQPWYVMLQWKYTAVDIQSDFVRMSWLHGFILISFNYYYNKHQEAVKWPSNEFLMHDSYSISIPFNIDNSLKANCLQ